MYMTALPCPPLPVNAVLSMPDGETKRVSTSSHDLLAGVLVGAMNRADAGRNRLRQKQQMALTDRLITALEGAAAPEAGYDACKRFTAEYILAFDDDASGASLQFLAMDEVERGSNVHKAACSWHAAQDIQHSAKGERRDASVFAKMSYKELIAEHLKRVVTV